MQEMRQVREIIIGHHHCSTTTGHHSRRQKKNSIVWTLHLQMRSKEIQKTGIMGCLKNFYINDGASHNGGERFIYKWVGKPIQCQLHHGQNHHVFTNHHSCFWYILIRLQCFHYLKYHRKHISFIWIFDFTAY